MRKEGCQEVFRHAGKEAAEWVPLVVERIIERFDPLRVVLFGSQARDEAGLGTAT